MGIVIRFPDSDERREKEIRELLSSLDYPNEQVRRCVKDLITPILLRYYNLPNYTFSFELPKNLPPTESAELAAKIEDEVKRYVRLLQKPMLREIGELHIALCLEKMHDR